jgi:hypothetical protein
MENEPGKIERDESPSTASRPRAAHWVEFYDRLVVFESEILETMESLSARLSADEQRAVEITNLEPMRELIADFKRRADVWREVA